MANMAMNTAVSGLQALEHKMAVTTNNITNVSSIGFKKSGVITGDDFYVTLKKAGILENAEAAPRPVGVQIGTGTKILGTYRNMQAGEFRQTSFPLDVAINGAGYFAVTLPNGRTGYTRAGAFHKSADGTLVTIEGNAVEIEGTIPAATSLNNIEISEKGTITDKTDPNNPQEVGQLKVYNFPNESGLEAVGNNLLVETPGSGERIEITDNTNKFKPGYLEESNVSAVEELMSLIAVHRDYELNLRVISTGDKMMEATNNIK